MAKSIQDKNAQPIDPRPILQGLDSDQILIMTKMCTSHRFWLKLYKL